MPAVHLTEEMIGKRSAEAVLYPRLDVDGKDVESQGRAYYNVRGIGNSQFVCIPAHKDSDEWQFVKPGEVVTSEAEETIEFDPFDEDDEAQQ